MLVEQLRITLQAIDRFDREIAELAPTLPDYCLVSRPCRVPARIWRRGLLAAFGEQRDASSTPMSCRNTPALRPSPNAAARRVGSIGAGSVRRFCARPLSNGRARPSTNRSGPAPTIGSSATKAALIKPQCVRWRSNGFASSIAVGKPDTHTMSPRISTPSESAARHCLRTSTWMRKTLDGLPQGVKPKLTTVRY